MFSLLRTVFVVALAAIACAPSVAPDTSPTTGSMADWNDYGDLEDLVRASDLVVEARVLRRLDTRDVRGYPAQRVPVAFTESVVEVRTSLKGNASGELQIVQLGREGDPAQTYPEFPILRPGTDVVLFLVDVSADPIHSDGRTKFAIVAPVGLLRIQGARLTSSAPGFRSTDRAVSMTLDQFRSVVRGVVRN